MSPRPGSLRFLRNFDKKSFSNPTLVFYVCLEGGKGGGGVAYHEVTIINFRFHESRNKKFTSVKFTEVTEKI